MNKIEEEFSTQKKNLKKNFSSYLFTHLDDFYRGSVDELPSTMRMGIEVTRVKERRKSNKN